MGELYLPKENDLFVNDNTRDLFFDNADQEGLLEMLDVGTTIMRVNNPILASAVRDSIAMKSFFFDNNSEIINRYYTRAFNLGSIVSYFVFSLNEPKDPTLDSLSYRMAINNIVDEDPSNVWKTYLYQDTNLTEIISVVADSLFPDNPRVRDFIDDGSGCISYFLNHQYRVQQNIRSN